jgi:hypothetical protein
LEGKINQVTVQSFPDEEVEILPGLKITICNLEGNKADEAGNTGILDEALK